MQKIDIRRRGLTLIELLVYVAMFIILVFLVRGCVGCGGAGPNTNKQPTAVATPAQQHPSELSLRGVLLGGWEKQTTPDGYKYLLDFTEKSLNWKYQEVDSRERRFGPKLVGNIDCGYSDSGSRIEVADSSGRRQAFEYEFLSDDEVSLAPSTRKLTTDTFTPEADRNMTTALSGRWRRVTRPSLTATEMAVVQAKGQVKRIEQNLKKLESLRGGAAKERDDIVGKLRELGVESAADLKRNPRALRMAENLAKLAAEIEGMDSQLATIDTELLKARSIARRIEREQAGISDDEMRQLSAQLRDAEARTDAAPTPITPLDVDAAVEAALKARRAAPRDKR